MLKKIVSTILQLFLLLSMTTLAFNIQPVEAEPSTIIVPYDYPTIQEAINNAEEGDRIFVLSGTYYENVIVNKTVSLIGENKSNTVISAKRKDHVVRVTANDVVVKGFLMRNAEGYFASGIAIIPPPQPPPPIFPMNATIEDNLITNNTCGLLLSSSNHKIVENTIEHNAQGVSVQAANNSIINNKINNNFFGIELNSDYNLLRQNEIFANNFNFILRCLDKHANDIDSSNTVDGKHVYYFVNQTNLEINPQTFPDLGYLGLVDCTNVTVSNLTLANNGQGILISGSTNITIEGNLIENNMIGVQAVNVNYSSILYNNVRNNYHGMTLSGGYNNVLTTNTINNNTVRSFPYRWPEWPVTPCRFWITDEIIWVSGGIYLWSNNNTLLSNTISNNEHGVQLFAASFNIFRNNSMTGNVYNFGYAHPIASFPPEWVINPPSEPQISPYFMNDIDTSNTVDGKPIYYWINRNNEQIPSDAGYVVLVNSTNMMIRDLTLQHNAQGILLFDTTGTVISNNIITNTRYGIQTRAYMFRSRPVNNTFKENNMTKNGIGIEIGCGSDNNIFDGSSKCNLIGIYLQTDSNTIKKNILMNNTLPPLEEWILGYIPPHFVDPLWFAVWGGILIEASNNNVCSNTLQCNDYGMSIGLMTGKGGNKIYHNNFISNLIEHIQHRREVKPIPSNSWDDGYPSGGNYWSDHTGPDLHYGHCQNLTGSDGIVDTPYVIDVDNQDNYPLMSPYEYWSDPIPGDINRDKKVDFDDIVQIAMAYGSTPEDPNWNPNADIDCDGDVDFDDIVTAAMNYGKGT